MNLFSLNEDGEALPLDAIAGIDEKEQGIRDNNYGAAGWMYLSRMLRTQIYLLRDELGAWVGG